MNIDVRGVSKSFGDFAALKDVGLSIPSGRLVALLGPSGSGKTTLLRVIAGLEAPSAGSVFFDEREMTGTHVGARNVGFVFQHYALFKHMSVFENVAFGLRVRPKSSRPTKADIRDKVMRLLAMVHLDPFADRMPSQLSGGQRQRVALARALAVEPKVLLLDEPFGALDAKVRTELRRWLRRLHDELHVTSLFVTHDQEEAMEVADLVVVMDQGSIQQIGTPAEIYHHPRNSFVYDFLGNVNLFHARLVDGKPPEILRSPAIDALTRPESGGKTGLVYVRPHAMDIERQPTGEINISARIRHVNTAGPLVKIELRDDAGSVLHVELTQERFRALALERDAPVFVIPRELRIIENG